MTKWNHRAMTFSSCRRRRVRATDQVSKLREHFGLERVVTGCVDLLADLLLVRQGHEGGRSPHGSYAASRPFSRRSHSSSSTISKRTILPRMAGTNSVQSVFFACREQRSNTERL